jgi:transmembrane sensor
MKATSLSDVFHAMERKYNVQIEANDAALLNERITISISNEPLQDVRQVMSYAKKFDHELFREKGGTRIVIRLP